MKRNVKILPDDTPENITLPSAKQFISGQNTDGSCGCLFGHAAYAFGLDVQRMSWNGEYETYVRAIEFCLDICKVLELQATSLNLSSSFDRWLEAEPRRAARVAHAWRVVADRWGYDVCASEPEWKP